MVLTGKAKTDYQREYMRRRRSNLPTVRPSDVRPSTVRPKIAARIAKVRPSDGTDRDNIRAATERLTATLGPAVVSIEPDEQSYNPMKVGYVPPKG